MDLSLVFLVLGWGHAVFCFEYSSEVTIVRESDGDGDLADSEEAVGVGEHCCGSFQANVLKPCHGSQSTVFALEQPVQMRNRNAQYGGHVLNGPVSTQIL